MKVWTTEIQAIGTNGEIALYRGPNIEAETMELAEKYCQENGLGYCKVKGELIEIDFIIYNN
jgi:hypothetical protein